MFFVPEDKRGLVHFKRIFLMIVYMIIFIFSIYAIIQIRFYTNNAVIEDNGQFIFLFIDTPTISHHAFLILKLSLFAFTAIMSFILMLSNYYIYQNPSLEKLLIQRTKRDIRKIIKNA